MPSDFGEVMRLLMSEDDADPAWSEYLGEESDISSEDEIGEREDGSETEQEADELESFSEEEDKDRGEYFMGRDKSTKWYKEPPNKRRHSSHNITTLPGVKGFARNAKTAAECWGNLFPDEMLEIIVKYTNQYIDTVKDNFIRERDGKPTDLIELKAFIGLLYLAGAYKSNRLLLEELWGKNGDGIEKFGLVMNVKRFKFMLRCLRFDDKTTRSERKKVDCLAAIRDVFEMFVQNCKKCYTPGENLTIDEMLPGFRGRCSFRQYIPSKPNKYGIKMYALVDSRMVYTLNLEVYVGKQPEGPFQLSNKPSDVVMRMTEPVLGSERNIVADNWFTDFGLVNLLKQNKLSYVGTVRKDKRALPDAFINTRGREQYSSLFGFNDGTMLTSYVPRKNKCVLLVSSMHESKAIDESTGEQKKPELITYYNVHKSGVDTADQMCATYSVQRNTQRWPMIIFYAMLNLGGINSLVIHLGNHLESMPRRVFLKKLSHELCIGQLQRRSQLSVHTSLKIRLKRFLPADDRPTSPPPLRKRSRCCDCTVETGIRRLTNYSCMKCNQGICLSHSKPLCATCFSACSWDPSGALMDDDTD